MAFTIEGPTCLTVEPGATVEATYKILVAAWPLTDATLLITGLPYGVSATFEPSSGNPPFDSILTVTSALDSEQDAWVLNITAWDAESSKTMPVVLSNFPVIVTPAPPMTVTTNASTYTAGATITVTIDHGLGGAEEWVGLWLSSSPDSGFSYLGNWKYHDGQNATVPSSGPTYPTVLTFTAPPDAGTYNMRYFPGNSPVSRLAMSANFTVTGVSPFVPDYYASPTGLSSNNGLTSGTPFRPVDFWTLAAPGVSLGLMDGVYTGANFMIEPPPGTSGEFGAPILIRAINDGGAIIDGESIREPVRLKGIDYMALEGFDARNSSDHAVIIGGSDTNTCSNITCRKMVAYDGALLNNSHVWMLWNCGENILIEDCAAFGIGRYSFIWYGTDHGDCIMRRCWGRWMRQTDSPSTGGPKAAFQFGYSSINCTLENCFATFDETENGGPSSYYERYGMINAANAPFVGTNNNAYGCMFYLRSSDAMAAPAPFEGGPGLYVTQTQQQCRLENCVVYIAPGTHTGLINMYLTNFDSADTERFATKITTIGGANGTIESQWTPSNNLLNQTSVPTDSINIWNGSSSTGARIYYRYENGALTGTPLWPWPMDSRIAAAITASGRSVTTFFGSGNTGLTDLMADIFGTIP